MSGDAELVKVGGLLWSQSVEPQVIEDEEIRRKEGAKGLLYGGPAGFLGRQLRPYGYVRVPVQDGGKKRPKLELDPARSLVVRRMFEMAESGGSVLDIARVLNGEGVSSSTGKL